MGLMDDLLTISSKLCSFSRSLVQGARSGVRISDGLLTSVKVILLKMDIELPYQSCISICTSIAYDH